MSSKTNGAVKNEPISPSDPKSSLNRNSEKIKKVFYDVFHPNVTVLLYHSNITEIENSVDALVNCTGPEFQTTGGISKSIVNGAGKKIYNDFEKHLKVNGRLAPLQVVHTPAYDLRQHKYILHVPSPSFHRRFTLHNNYLTSENELVYTGLLKKVVRELKLDSFAVPLIGTGLARIPVDESLNDLMESIRNFSSFPSSGLKIYVVNNDLSIVKFMERFIQEKLLYSKVKVEKIEPKVDEVDEGHTVKEEKLEPIGVKKEESTEHDDQCAICLCKIENGKKLSKCNHEFCQNCIDQHFKYKKTCPTCGWVYDIVNGNQPDGKMTCKRLDMALPGFDYSVKTIEIVYSIPSGIQNSNHPNPGKPYRGAVRTAYLPDNEEGNKVLKLLQRAFEHKLVFTVGQSRTTGADNVVTWNDIHHKTSTHGGTSNFGYPDATYLSRVTQELAAKGIF